MRIGFSIASLRAQRDLATISRAISRSLERLSSGNGLVDPREDIVSYAQSVRLESQARGLALTARAINDSLSSLQAKEGGLSSQMDLVARMRELAVEAASNLLTDGERASLNNELKSLIQEFERISHETEFNETRLLEESRGSTSFLVDQATGAFATTAERSMGATTFNLLADDLDGDGVEDLVSVQSDQFVVQRGIGDGTFLSPTTYSLGGGQVNGLRTAALEDLDQDGDLDLVMSGSLTTNLMMRLNNGSGVFTAAMTLAAVVPGLNSIALGDFNGDEVSDIVMTSTTGNHVVRFGDGFGSFTFGQTLSVAAAAQPGVDVADTDGDGDLDIAFSDPTNDRVLLWNNSGTGVFSPGQTISGTAGFDVAQSVHFADFDGDGDDDLLVAPFGATFSLFLNNGLGVYGSESTFSSINNVSGRETKVDDFDNDGDVDIATVSASTDSLVILSNSGTGTFTPSLTFTPSAADSYSFVIKDLDGDEFSDIALTTLTSFTSIVSLAETREVAAGAELSLLSASRAAGTLDILDRTLQLLMDRRAEVGALQNRLDFERSSSLLLADANLAALDRARELDYALEIAELTSLQIRQQASLAVLTQANLSLQVVLALLPQQ